MMVLRIIRTPNGKKRILYRDGCSASATDKALLEVLLHQANAGTLTGGDDCWELDCNSMEEADGKTLAYIDDKGNLVISADNPFLQILTPKQEQPQAPSAEREDVEYISIEQYASEVERNDSRIRVLCREGRFPGAKKIGNRWVIPKGTPFPSDNRYKEPPKRIRRKQPRI